MAVLDTSVLVAAAIGHHAASAPRRVVAAAIAGLYDSVLSLPIREETTEVLGRPAAGSLEPGDVDEVLSEFWETSRWVQPAPDDPSYEPVVHDPQDVMVLRTAVGALMIPELAIRPRKFIISDNTRHFRPGVTWAGFRFVTANIFWRELRSGAG